MFIWYRLDRSGLRIIGNDSATFDSIKVEADGINISGISSPSFVWTRASGSSECSDCGTIRLSATGRFFKCSGTPTFKDVSVSVMAPSCRLLFVDSDVTILKDKSSPEPLYQNCTITDFSNLIEIFGPKYETEYFTGFREYYDQEWQLVASNLGILLAISIAALFIVHPDMFSFF